MGLRPLLLLVDDVVASASAESAPRTWIECRPVCINVLLLLTPSPLVASIWFSLGLPCLLHGSSGFPGRRRGLVGLSAVLLDSKVGRMHVAIGASRNNRSVCREGGWAVHCIKLLFGVVLSCLVLLLYVARVLEVLSVSLLLVWAVWWPSWLVCAGVVAEVVVV